MKNLVIVALFLTASAFSCKKPDDTPVGGKGGNAVLNIYPAHHGKSVNLINMKVYIKYNSSNTPSFYDDSAACTGLNTPFATITGLKKGNYYLYGAGYDTSIHLPVHGGAPYTITDEVTQTVNLAVSEE